MLGTARAPVELPHLRLRGALLDPCGFQSKPALRSRRLREVSLAVARSVYLHDCFSARSSDSFLRISGFGRCKGLGKVEEICRPPRPNLWLPAPITSGPSPALGNALALENWSPVDGEIQSVNVTGPLQFSWAHIPASPKLVAAVSSYTLEVTATISPNIPPSVQFDPISRCHFVPSGSNS